MRMPALHADEAGAGARSGVPAVELERVFIGLAAGGGQYQGHWDLLRADDYLYLPAF